jgi:hypothetical protein
MWPVSQDLWAVRSEFNLFISTACPVLEQYLHKYQTNCITSVQFTGTYFACYQRNKYFRRVCYIFPFSVRPVHSIWFGVWVTKLFKLHIFLSHRVFFFKMQVVICFWRLGRYCTKTLYCLQDFKINLGLYHSTIESLLNRPECEMSFFFQTRVKPSN